MTVPVDLAHDFGEADVPAVGNLSKTGQNSSSSDMLVLVPAKMIERFTTGEFMSAGLRGIGDELTCPQGSNARRNKTSLRSRVTVIGEAETDAKWKPDISRPTR